jgi:pyruvate formate lyase activating enzyme
LKTKKRGHLGYINSIQSFGTVDGPGIRFVLFTSGCPLRCLYCHNPDCQDIRNGKKMSVSEIMDEVLKYRVFMESSGGGITISGGEPLLQWYFCMEIFSRCKELGIHTTLDTSGALFSEQIKEGLDKYVDLVLLDIKSMTPSIYEKVTSYTIRPTLEMANYLNEISKPTWIRFVLVPGVTNDIENMKSLASFVKDLKNVERFEVLPFHKMGEYKWESLKMNYELKSVSVPNSDEIKKAHLIFEKYNLPIKKT